jgi:hypothetical protein
MASSRRSILKPAKKGTRSAKAFRMAAKKVTAAKVVKAKAPAKKGTSAMKTIKTQRELSATLGRTPSEALQRS